MKKHRLILISILCVFFLSGCQHVEVAEQIASDDNEILEEVESVEESEQKNLIPMVMIDEEIYIDTGIMNVAEARCGMMDGEITSKVDTNERPTVNNQSNFGTGYGYQYGSQEGTIEINMNGQWRVFATEDAKNRMQFEISEAEEVTIGEMLGTFQNDYGWTTLEDQKLYWNTEEQCVLIRYYFEENAEEWQMDSAKEYGLKTFVFKQYLTLSNPQPYQIWSQEKDIKEVIIHVFADETMIYQDIYRGIEDGIVHGESHYVETEIPEMLSIKEYNEKYSN